MMARMEGRKECRASARAGRVPPFLQQKVKGCKRHGSRQGRMWRTGKDNMKEDGLIRLIPGTIHYSGR